MRNTKCVLAILLTVAVSSAQTDAITQWGIHGGMSRIVDIEEGRWDVGYRIGGQGLILANEYVGLGLLVSWERMAPNVSTWGEMLANAGHLNVDGSQDLIDIHPILRFESASPHHTVNVFGQVGVGMHIQRASLHSATGALVLDESSLRFSTSFALGLSFGYTDGLRLELFPAYNMALPLSEAVDFYSINAGLSIRL